MWLVAWLGAWAKPFFLELVSSYRTGIAELASRRVGAKKPRRAEPDGAVVRTEILVAADRHA